MCGIIKVTAELAEPKLYDLPQLKHNITTLPLHALYCVYKGSEKFGELLLNIIFL